MKSLAAQLEALFKEALVQVIGDEARSIDPIIRPAGEEKFGDYQSNVAMGLAKKLGQKPRDLAQKIVDTLQQIPQAAQLCEPFEIAGPGFINIRLKLEGLTAALSAIPDDDRLGIEPTSRPQTIVVDYSGPNIAKQMHVGHLRSTIIGDSIARILEFEGHRVIRQNHIGDWGTQFGMLIAYLKDKMPAALDKPGEVHLADLEQFYREASARDKSDPDFHERARAEVVALHQHEPSTLKAWKYIVDESRNHYMPIYKHLGVNLTTEDERGESFYAEHLPQVVEQLKKRFATSGPLEPQAGVEAPRIKVEQSDGAWCVFHIAANGEPAFKNPKGDAFPMIIQKSDGAFIYATTDLAAVQFRIKELHSDRIIYVTDARQALHFQMVFATVRAAGWTLAGRDHEAQLEHITYGSILGEDRTPLKTRSGDNIKLADLLDEAVRRSEQLIRANEADPEKKRGFTEEEIHDIAEAVGIGAVKYADLSQNRQSDYVFSWDKMLAMEGNTAPYLMYAYARIRSIYRKGASDSPGESLGKNAVVLLNEPAERNLGRQILRFAETIESIEGNLKLNVLTEYLYELAGAFMSFYERCPVLTAPTPELRASRLRLADLTARTLRIGLGLLGIRVVERM